MIQVNCYSCGGSESACYASENGFKLVKCKQCGLLYVKSRPEDAEIEAAHKIGLHRGQDLLDVTGRFRRSNVRRFVKILRDMVPDVAHMKEKVWLDIGCGNGEFLAALQDFGGDRIIAKGVEPNVYKQKEARKRNLDVCYFDLDRHTEKYDVISLLNVFSHLPDPPVTIASWKSLLKPGGEIILQTGDTCNFSSEDHHKPFYLPDHLSFASEEIVVGILKKLGFRIVTVKKYPLVERNIISLAKEFVKMIIPNRQSNIKQILWGAKYKDSDMFVRAVLIDSSPHPEDGTCP